MRTPGVPGGEPPGGLRREVGVATSATFVIFVADRLVQVGFLAVLARLLGPAEFAVATAAVLFVSLVTLVSQLGAGAALVQAPQLSANATITARTLVFAAAVVLAALAELCAPLIGAWFNDPQVTLAVRFLAPVCLVQALAFVPHAMLTRRLKARQLSLADLFSGVVGQGAVAIPMAMLGFSYWALVAGAATTATVRMIAMLVMERIPPGARFDLGEARWLLSRGFGFSLTVFLQRLGVEADRVIIGRFLGGADLGLYARANGLMALPAAFYGAVIDRVVFPAFARVQESPSRLGAAYAQGMAITALIGIPAMALLFVLGPEIIRFVLGPQWLGAIEPFKLLSLAAYFRMADRVNGTLLRGVGKPYLMAGVQLVAATAMAAGCLWVVRDGIAAVAAVVVVASTFSFATLTGAAMRVTGVGAGDMARAHGPALATGLLTLLLVVPPVWLARKAGWEPFPILALAGISAAAALPVMLALPGVFLGRAGVQGLAVLKTVLRRRGR